MRAAVVLLLFAAGCASQSAKQSMFTPEEAAFFRRQAEEEPAARARFLALYRPQEPVATPEQTAKAARENELLERALTNAPDYTAAVRRAAIANVDAGQPPAQVPPRERQRQTQLREERITAEEARLFDAVELRRRARLADNARADQSQRDQQAAYACEARARQMEAAYYNPRELVNLYGMIQGEQAKQACIEAYRRTGAVP